MLPRLQKLGLLAGACFVLHAGAAFAQASPSPFTNATRYDPMGRVTGTIEADPDGAGQLMYRATRNTYDAAGSLVKVENGVLSNWKSEAVAPSAWGTAASDGDAFTVFSSVETTYDAIGRKLTERKVGPDSIVYVLTQYSYDAAGRLECTALRMNPAAYGSLPASACTLGTEGSQGPDRITRNIVDAGGQILQVREGVGTSVEAAEVTYSYTPAGKIEFVIDAGGNRAKFEYDGHGRKSKWSFPSTTRASAYNPSTPANALATAGAISTTDFEQYLYDANSNVVELRQRGYAADSTRKILSTYDNLNRVVTKDLPGNEPTTTYTYDLSGNVLTTSNGGLTLTNSYDALGRLLTAQQPFGSMSYQYDASGRKSRATWQDGFYVTYDYFDNSAVKAVRENGAASGAGVLATYAYDNQGNLASITRGNGTVTTYTVDPVSRLTQLAQDYSGATHDLTLGFSYNPASQIASTTRSNDLYAWTGGVNVNRAYTVNGLSQYVTAGPASFTYDARGNLTGDGTNTYTYTAENMLASKSGGITLHYDPALRLVEYDTTVSTRFVYDGPHMAAEVSNPAGTILRRYVFGPGDDAPIVWYEGSGTSDRRWLHADERGSIVAVSNGSGTVLSVNTYDEYGIPGAGNAGRFQYTGQAWLPELGLHYYKARMYSPTLGRFMQTDPIGYEDQFNLYAYVANDPVNKTDPTGMCVGPLIIPCGIAAEELIVAGAAAATAACALTCEKIVNAVVNAIVGKEDGVPASDRTVSRNDNGGPREPGPKVGVPAPSERRQQTGSYTNTHESGRTYSGKGSTERSQESGRRIERLSGDRHIATDWKPAPSSRDAFKAESRRIEQNGGPRSPDNHNRIDSPGTRYRKIDDTP